MRHSKYLFHWSLLTLAILGILVGCRTLDLVMGRPVPRASVLLAYAQRAARETAESTTMQAALADEPTEEATVPAADAVTEVIPSPFPTDLPPPVEQATGPQPIPTEIPPPTQEPEPTRAIVAPAAPRDTPVPPEPVATPGPTRCPQTYCVVYRGCQTDAGNTIVEGFVYNQGAPENGVYVRVAKEAGAYPLVDDFRSGDSSINPGKPDPANPGHYFLQIVAGAPQEGNWWVFVVDTRKGTKVMSEAKLIHTNDDPNNPANCQHAFVDFVR